MAARRERKSCAGIGCAGYLLLNTVGLVGCLLALPVLLPDMMSEQTPPLKPHGTGEWAVLYGIPVLVASAVVAIAGRAGRFVWWLFLARVAVMLAAVAGAVLYTESRVSGLPWNVRCSMEGLAAGLAALVVHLGVRWWDKQRGARPLPGEVWLAMVPLREDPKQQLRHYCVVLGTGSGGARVAQITSKDKDGRRDHIRIPNDGWDEVSGRPHWVEIGREPRVVPYREFLKTRPQGRCPPLPGPRRGPRPRGPRRRCCGGSWAGTAADGRHRRWTRSPSRPSGDRPAARIRSPGAAVSRPRSQASACGVSRSVPSRTSSMSRSASHDTALAVPHGRNVIPGTHPSAAVSSPVPKGRSTVTTAAPSQKLDEIRAAITRTSRLRGSRNRPVTVSTRPRRTAVSSRDSSADVAGRVPARPGSLIGTMPPIAYVSMARPRVHSRRVATIIRQFSRKTRGMSDSGESRTSGRAGARAGPRPRDSPRWRNWPFPAVPPPPMIRSRTTAPAPSPEDP